MRPLIRLRGESRLPPDSPRLVAQTAPDYKGNAGVLFIAARFGSTASARSRWQKSLKNNNLKKTFIFLRFFRSKLKQNGKSTPYI
jgi:hypothetical protein